MSKIIEKKLVPVKRVLVCECGTEMEHTGMVYMSNPVQYPHKCPNCGYEETIVGKSYPCIEFEEVE